MTPQEKEDLKPLVWIFGAAGVLFLILIFVIIPSMERHTGDIVPCSNYVTVTSKYKSLDDEGNVHFNLVLSNGRTVEIHGWVDDDYNYAAWNRTKLNTVGYLLEDPTNMRYSKQYIAFVPQNVTEVNGGNNFCRVV